MKENQKYQQENDALAEFERIVNSFGMELDANVRTPQERAHLSALLALCKKRPDERAECVNPRQRR